MHFKIHGQGKKNLNGDGLAIWYTKERMQKGKHNSMHFKLNYRAKLQS